MDIYMKHRNGHFYGEVAGRNPPSEVPNILEA